MNQNLYIKNLLNLRGLGHLWTPDGPAPATRNPAPLTPEDAALVRVAFDLWAQEQDPTRPSDHDVRQTLIALIAELGSSADLLHPRMNDWSICDSPPPLPRIT